MCEEQIVADFDIPSIMERAGGFSPHAFQFIRDGLSHTVSMVHGEDADSVSLRSQILAGGGVVEALRTAMESHPEDKHRQCLWIQDLECP